MQAVDNLMPGFDKEIAKMAQRILINPRKIDWRTGVLATKVTPGEASCLKFCKNCPPSLFQRIPDIPGNSMQQMRLRISPSHCL